MTSLYSSGLMTELKGRIIIENTGYHGEAFITSKKCNRHTTENGIQQRKSVAMMMDILVCNFRSLLRVTDVFTVTPLDDLVTKYWITM